MAKLAHLGGGKNTAATTGLLVMNKFKAKRCLGIGLLENMKGINHTNDAFLAKLAHPLIKGGYLN